MIAIKPWFGFGSGGFEAHYMDYQAQFFHRNPDSGYAILADTVQQPFNEFLRIAVDYGLGGLLGLLGMIVFLILCYQKCNSCYKDLAALSLCSITVFSLFSYPFLYPFTWAVVLLDLVILAGNTWHIHWKIFSVVGDIMCYGEFVHNEHDGYSGKGRDEMETCIVPVFVWAFRKGTTFV